jgi:hypothetical protein
MKTFTLTLTEQQLAQISGLVAAAGKSPHTGAEGILAAADALKVLQEAVDKAEQDNAAQDSNVTELPAKDAG